MRVVLITSTGLRHRAFVAHIAQTITPVLIVQEPKRIKKGTSGGDPSYQQAFADAEQAFFSDAPLDFPDTPVHQTAPGDINAAENLAAIRAVDPDLLLVFGASILSKELLSIPRKGSINIHTGLTQAFRGVDSAFWAIHDHQPEGIGVTVHLVDPQIDTGAVLLQARPVFSADESEHVIFFKTVLDGFKLMAQAAPAYLAGEIHPQPLAQRGKLYMLKDLSQEAIDKVQVERQGIMAEYLEDKAVRDTALPLIGATR